MKDIFLKTILKVSKLLFVLAISLLLSNCIDGGHKNQIIKKNDDSNIDNFITLIDSCRSTKPKFSIESLKRINKYYGNKELREKLIKNGNIYFVDYLVDMFLQTPESFYQGVKDLNYPEYIKEPIKRQISLNLDLHKKAYVDSIYSSHIELVNNDEVDIFFKNH